MKKLLYSSLFAAALFAAALVATFFTARLTLSSDSSMDLGAFSISLNVKNLQASKAFYQKLGFKPTSGDEKQNWLVMRNGDHVIGLFQGMFEKNMLTFNPGWDQHAQPTKTFTDIRELQRRLKASGIAFELEASDSTTGPASFIIHDPDGNPILADQFR